MASRFASSARDVAILLAPFLLGWLVVFAFVPPARQNFPLIDDAAYNASLRSLTETGAGRYYHWAFMPQIGHWLWAAPFVKALGAQFVATRVSTIVLAALAIVALSSILRSNVRNHPADVRLACWLVALNPLFFMLSGTFMTDVPTLAFSLLGIAAFAAGMRQASTLLVLAGGLGAAAAVATRQNAAPVLLVMALMWVQHRREQRSWVPPLTIAVAALIGIGVELWFVRRDDVMRFAVVVPSLPHLVKVVAGIGIYMGLFMLPLAVRGWRSQTRRWLILAAALTAAWLFFVRVVLHQPFATALFPFVDNVLTPYGAFGFGYVVGQPPLLLPIAMRVLLTLAGACGMAWLLRQAWRAWQARAWDPLIWFGVLGVPFMLITVYLFDRYLIVFLPAAAALAIRDLPVPASANRRMAYALLVAYAVVSVSLVHDWLAWNSARWQLGRQALAVFTPSEIEGGFEWDHHFAIAEGRIPASHRQPQGLALAEPAKLFDGLSGLCAIAFSPVPNTEVIDRATFDSWLTLSRREMVLVCHAEGAARARAAGATGAAR